MKIKAIAKEFEKFIARGSVIDLAVGVIVGGAFGKIVSSLVDDILMPIFGLILGGIDFSDLSWTVGEAEVKYGLFIQNVVDFLIIAFCIFLMVQLLNKIMKRDDCKKAEAVAEAKKTPTVEEQQLEILMQIRDRLAKSK